MNYFQFNRAFGQKYQKQEASKRLDTYVDGWNTRAGPIFDISYRMQVEFKFGYKSDV